MLYWYHDLIVAEGYKSNLPKHIKRVEQYYRATPKSRIFSDKKRKWERFVGKRIPWKEYFVITRAVNPVNLFEVMSTRFFVFRQYSRMDLYVIGLFDSEYGAMKAMEEILSEGYCSDPDFEPRSLFGEDEDFVPYEGWEDR